MLEELSEFVGRESRTTDIFCFQEVLDSDTDVPDYPYTWKGRTFKMLKNQLGGFHAYLTEPYTSFMERLTTFVKKDAQVLEASWQQLVPQQRTDSYSIGSNIQYVRLKSNGRDFLVANTHGYWVKGNCRDTEERIQQSKKIISILRYFKTLKILCGDFNLAPDTESIGLLENSFTNLTKKYSVETTRSPLVEKGKCKIVDYVLVSNGIGVRDFKPIDSGASDHLALQLDFEIVPQKIFRS